MLVYQRVIQSISKEHGAIGICHWNKFSSRMVLFFPRWLGCIRFFRPSSHPFYRWIFHKYFPWIFHGFSMKTIQLGSKAMETSKFWVVPHHEIPTVRSPSCGAAAWAQRCAEAQYAEAILEFFVWPRKPSENQRWYGDGMVNPKIAGIYGCSFP